MDHVACLNYHNQSSVYIFILQKGQILHALADSAVLACSFCKGAVTA